MRWSMLLVLLWASPAMADVIYVQQTASTSIPYYGYQPIKTYYYPVYTYPSYAPTVVNNTVQQSQIVTINNYCCKEATPDQKPVKRPVKKPIRRPERRMQLYDE